MLTVYEMSFTQVVLETLEHFVRGRCRRMDPTHRGYLLGGILGGTEGRRTMVSRFCSILK